MKKNMNNKGFSLVELIIVIAIMAVLIGVLAPQYLKYVKESKISTDITNAENVATAVNVGIADPKCGVAGIAGTSGSLSGGVGTAIYTTAAQTAAGLNNVTLPDSKVKPGSTWVITYGNNGVSQITLNATNSGSAAQIWPDATAFQNANS